MRYPPRGLPQQQGQGGGDKNYFNNNHFSNQNQNQNRNAQPFNNRNQFYQPKQDAIPQPVTDFMHEQGKMNQILFEQLQAMNEKLSRLSVGESSGSANGAAQPKLPSQPTNPHEEVKALHILRSGTKYQDPPMPDDAEPGKPAGSPAALSPVTPSVCGPDIRQPPVEYYPEANFRRSRCFQSKLQDSLESDSQEGPPHEF